MEIIIQGISKRMCSYPTISTLVFLKVNIILTSQCGIENKNSKVMNDHQLTKYEIAREPTKQ